MVRWRNRRRRTDDAPVARFACGSVVVSLSRALAAGDATTIRAPVNEIFLSAVSTWELGLKIAKGKLRLPSDYAEGLVLVTADREIMRYDVPVLEA